MCCETEDKNKKVWMLHVANTLGFETMPEYLLPKAETLYDGGYVASQAIYHLKRMLMPNKQK